ncbi:uncharacterized protein EKO05_0009329 [Ascochyta rabiei]|uniref:Uncharacterized protein n=1 Tax=Didymella rabiei TaxID=5454 RepID=A0A163EYT7_DIDRA|nr:uncharacterized protein EKO05_0009329 [Ascochyta rabiei]KZM24025.1 hypothetical protein ST47_g4904 [Ascochyta rabiei]UPX19053.1 hypothetical protein EKO05_0009329 [Ascochyta rabiei]
MEPKDHYTAKHFRRYARKEFPDQYALFRDLYMYNFENKTYVDKNHAAHDVSVLLVGHYRARKGGPPVWAQATETCVKYYQGKMGDILCTPIPEEHVTRIYYFATYSSVVGTQVAKSRVAGRRAEHYFAETIFSVLFLLTGRLEQVSNPGKTDMLSNFKYVCMSTMPKPKVQELVSPTVVQRPALHQAHDTVERENRKRKRSTHDHGQRIKKEDDASTAAEYSTNRPGPSSPSWTRRVQHSSSQSPLPYRLSRHASRESLLVQPRDFELEQEKRAHSDEVQALQGKLNEQVLRAQAAEEKVFRQKKKRKRAETQIEDLISQARMLEERNESLEVECVGPRRHTCKARIEGQKKEINRIRQSVLARNETISRLRKALAEMDKAFGAGNGLPVGETVVSKEGPG